jgi:hypothetical protein
MLDTYGPPAAILFLPREQRQTENERTPSLWCELPLTLTVKMVACRRK